MSATNRARGVRRDHDAYATPEWVARLFGAAGAVMCVFILGRAS